MRAEIEQMFDFGGGETTEAWEEQERTAVCPVCGQVHPQFQVEDGGRQVLGCERCLTIRRRGVVQL